VSARRDPIDLERLRRAVHLDVRELGPARYQVSGGEQPHLVTLEPTPACDCADCRYRSVRCAHRLAVALHCGHPAVLARLRELVDRPRRRGRASTAGVCSFGLVA
jgi:hypothetical protein